MNKELNILEEANASIYGFVSTTEAVALARLLVDGGDVRVFSRFNNAEDFRLRKSDVYHEGWEYSNDEPDNYSMVGGALNGENSFLTMISPRGKKKQGQPVASKHFTLYYRFKQLFSGSYTVERDRIIVVDRKMLGEMIEKWDNITKQVDGRPMKVVIDSYSLDELETISGYSDDEIKEQIQFMERLLSRDRSYRNLPRPLLLKGLLGFGAPIQNRLTCRLEFWKQVLRDEANFVTLAKTFSTVIDDWNANKEGDAS